MENVRKMARSHSMRVTEFLRSPSVVEEVVEPPVVEDSEAPTVLPILRVAGREGTKQQRREREREMRDKVGERQTAGSTGNICYSDVLHLLTCPACGSLVTPPVIQCRRGHLYCSNCSNSHANCLICKQAWQDTPNVALDKIIALIALPCKFG